MENKEKQAVLPMDKNNHNNNNNDTENIDKNDYNDADKNNQAITKIEKKDIVNDSKKLFQSENIITIKKKIIKIGFISRFLKDHAIGNRSCCYICTIFLFVI